MYNRIPTAFNVTNIQPRWDLNVLRSKRGLFKDYFLSQGLIFILIRSMHEQLVSYKASNLSQRIIWTGQA